MTAFLFRCLVSGALDAEAHALIEALPAQDRRVLELLVRVADPRERLRQLAQQSGEEWSAARYDRAEQRALRLLRQSLAQRDLLQP